MKKQGTDQTGEDIQFRYAVQRDDKPWTPFQEIPAFTVEHLSQDLFAKDFAASREALDPEPITQARRLEEAPRGPHREIPPRRSEVEPLRPRGEGHPRSRPPGARNPSP